MPFESFGRVFNASGEIVAEGSCSVDYDRGAVTLHPVFDAPLLTRQQGDLRLELDEGGDILLKSSVIRFRLNVPGAPPGPAYRMLIAAGGLSQGYASNE
jgi:hypothetical protein